MSEEQPGYAERDQEPTTEPTGGDPEVLEEEEAHEERPAGEGQGTGPDEGGATAS